MMWKANESKLAKALKKNVSSNSFQADQSFRVVDGGALLHKKNGFQTLHTNQC